MTKEMEEDSDMYDRTSEEMPERTSEVLSENRLEI